MYAIELVRVAAQIEILMFMDPYDGIQETDLRGLLVAHQMIRSLNLTLRSSPPQVAHRKIISPSMNPTDHPPLG